MTRVVKHDEYVRMCYENKRVTVGGREVPVLRMLAKLSLMDAYVAESPGKAETLFYALRDNPLFAEQARGLGTSFFMKYHDNPDRDASARHIREDVQQLEVDLG